MVVPITNIIFPAGIFLWDEQKIMTFANRLKRELLAKEGSTDSWRSWGGGSGDCRYCDCFRKR